MTEDVLPVMGGPVTAELLRKRFSPLLFNVASLSEVMTNVLTYKRLETGNLAPSFSPFDAVRALAGVAESTRMQLGSKPVRVEFVVPEGPLTVLSDPAWFRQIVWNLMSNAAKFTDRGAIALILSAEDGEFHVRVTDTGIGIRKEDITRLFKPFTQLDAGRNAHRTGTGLGLATTRRMLERLGGRITIASKFGEGTICEVSAPQALPERGEEGGEPGVVSR
jgi:hypothetical protein